MKEHTTTYRFRRLQLYPVERGGERASSHQLPRKQRMSSSLHSRLSPLPSKRLPPPHPRSTSAATLLRFPSDPPFAPASRAARFKCSAGEPGFFTKLGRLIKEKAKSDVEKVFSGFSKTRANLAVVDELLLYWNLSDTDRVLDELEEVRDFILAKFYAIIIFLRIMVISFPRSTYGRMDERIITFCGDFCT